MSTTENLVSLNGVRREFTMARDLLSTVIRAQAGSLEKALLEGVMNSIDAGAKNVRIELTPTSVSVVDDGRGMQTEDEVTRYFECFGTKHEDGDARFGRFRIGRAQLFCYGKNVWKTNKFKMTVDLGTGSDYSYELSGLLNKVKGCDIHIELYKPLNPAEEATCRVELEKYLRMMPSKIFLNGKRINKAPEERKDWTHEDELAYYKVCSSTNESDGVLLYNNGAFVREMSRKDWGVHAIVCSKVPLTLNSARTEVLYSQCTYTAVIQERLRTLVARELAETKRKLTQTDRNFVARTLANAVRDNRAYTLPRGLMRLKVLKDVHDRLISFEDLYKAKCVAPYDWALETESMAVNRSGRAIVLSSDTTDVLEVWSNPDRLSTLLGSLKRSGLTNEPVPEAKYIKELRRGLNGESNVIADEKIPLESRVLWSMMKALRLVNKDIADTLSLSKACGGTRTLQFGDSAGNLAWTDGSSFIAISRKHLLKCAEMGFGGMLQLVNLLVHEYCHDDLDAESHHHDTLFYSSFHDLMVHNGAAWGTIAQSAYSRFMAILNGECVASEQPAVVDQMQLAVKKLVGTPKLLKKELELYDEGFINSSLLSGPMADEAQPIAALCAMQQSLI